jgi:hypothetical protein
VQHQQRRDGCHWRLSVELSSLASLGILFSLPLVECTCFPYPHGFKRTELRGTVDTLSLRSGGFEDGNSARDLIASCSHNAFTLYMVDGAYVNLNCFAAYPLVRKVRVIPDPDGNGMRNAWGVMRIHKIIRIRPDTKFTLLYPLLIALPFYCYSQRVVPKQTSLKPRLAISDSHRALVVSLQAH